MAELTYGETYWIRTQEKWGVLRKIKKDRAWVLVDGQEIETDRKNVVPRNQAPKSAFLPPPVMPRATPADSVTPSPTPDPPNTSEPVPGATEASQGSKPIEPPKPQVPTPEQTRPNAATPAAQPPPPRPPTPTAPHSTPSTSKKATSPSAPKGASSSAPKATAPTPPKAPPPPPPDPRIVEVETIGKEAWNGSNEEDLAAVTGEPKPPAIDLDGLWRIACDARDLLRNQSTRLSEATTATEKAKKAFEDKTSSLDGRDHELDGRDRALDSREAGLDRRKADLDTRQAALDARQAGMETRKKELDGVETDINKRKAAIQQQEAALLKREEDVTVREANAEAGFVEQRRSSMAELGKAVASLQEDLTATEEAIAEARAAWIEERRADLETHRAKLEGEWKAHLARLDGERTSLTAEYDRRKGALESDYQAREADIVRREKVVAETTRGLEERERQIQREQDRRKRKLDAQEEDLKEYREDLDNRAEEKAAAIRVELENQLKALQARLDQSQSDRDALDTTLRLREEADRRFGQRTVDEVLAELEALQKKNAELAGLLAARPDADASRRLADLEEQRAGWESDRQEMLRQVAELEGRLARTQTSAVELETRKDQIAALESSRATLQQALKDMRAEMDLLISKSEGKTPFPACSAMDQDPEMQSGSPLHEDVEDLGAFVADLQKRIAFDPEHPERKLYYTLEDLRAFLAGIAMSPLVLLQGISGTGKTSLPVAFARAVGTKATIVEVQAGWRDPQDLAGHYNAFEKKFYEREFLKALYRAQTPRWRDTLQLVVLDEMNLSHPEQYFSDLLSAMEQKPEDRKLVLMTHAVHPAPALLREGAGLPVPRNVWFVGTANHDETTKDFADKTYDRAHVMEFPHRPAPFPVSQMGPRTPVSYSALMEAFDTAIRQKGASAEAAIKYFNDQLRDPLGQWLQVGWGPRLEKQMERYVPVVVAAGGTTGEAVDHILAMRLLRKLKARHDNRPEHLEGLRQRIETTWTTLGKGPQPRRSIALLKDELRRMGRSAEDKA